VRKRKILRSHSIVAIFYPHLAVCCAECVIRRVNEHSAGIHILGIAGIRPQRQVEAALVPLPRDLRVKRHEDEQRAGVYRFFSKLLEFGLRGR
jgi:hypothetical protein